MYEGDRIVLTENAESAAEFCRTSSQAFGAPKTSTREIKPEGHGGQHRQMLQDFLDAIQEGREPIAPAAEGINSVELANAMLLSAWTGASVKVPIDAVEYEAELGKKIAGSRARTGSKTGVEADMSKSFG